MKKLVIILILLCINQSTSRAMVHRFAAEAGVSNFTSGAGFVLSYQIGFLSLNLGAGTVLNADFSQAISPAAGIKIFLTPSKNSVYLGASLGRTYYKGASYNPDYGYSGASRDEIDLYYGPSFTGGYRFLFGSKTAFVLNLGAGVAYKPDIDFGWKVEQAGWIFMPDITVGIAF